MGFLIPALATFIGFALIGVWPFGNGTVLIVDSIHQYLPFYTDLHEKLVNHESLLYSFSAGLGYDFWATFAYYMASPLNFLLALLPKANVADAMDLFIILKIGLCGGTFSWYLHKREPGRKFLPLVFGAMFALSNFMIGYYFNLMWLDSVAMLPLIMMGIERITEGKSGKMYGLSLFYGLWCNYYIGFMLCIFSCLYFVVCLVSKKKIRLRATLKSGLRFGWFSLLAGGMASAVLLPAYMALTSSESMKSNSFPSVIKFYTNFIDMMMTQFALNEPINISDSQVGLNAYCGVIVLILTLLYVMDDWIRIRERLAKLCLTGLLLLSFSMNVLNYIWHGFHVQNGLPNRFAFLYISMLLVMGYDVLGHVRKLPLWKILVSGAVPVVFVAVAGIARLGGLKDYVYLVTLGLLIVYLNLLLIIKLWDRKKTLTLYLVGGVMVAEAVGHGIYGIHCNGRVTRSIYLADQASFMELTGRQEEEDFYRSEIDSQRMRNVTMYAGGHALVMFNSTMPASTTELCKRLGIEARTNKNGYNGVTKLMNDVFGIKYVLSSNGDADTLYQFNEIDEDDNLTLYRNDNALSIGFMVDKDIREWDIEFGNPLDVQNHFVELAAGEEEIFEWDRDIIMEDGKNYGISIPEDKQVYMYLPSSVEKLELHTPEYSKTYNTFTDHLYVINEAEGNADADFTVTLKSGQSTQTAMIYTCDNEQYEKVVEKLAENQLEQVEATGNRLSGTIHADHEGTLLLTIPYSKNWQVEVDGEETEAACIGDALMGIELSAGDHEIRMKYIPGGLGMGITLSLVCAALYVLTCVLEKRRKGEEEIMKPEFSEKAESFGGGIFAILNERKEELQKEGSRWELRTLKRLKG